MVDFSGADGAVGTFKRKPLGPLQGQPQAPGIGGSVPGINPNAGGPMIAPKAPEQNAIAPGGPAPATAPAPGTFGATQNLIGTQFNPTADPRLQQTQNQVSGLQSQLASNGGQLPGAQQAQGLLNQAQGQIGQAQLGPLQGLGADVGTARSSTLQALGNLNSAPSRSQSAQSLYDALSNQETANTGGKIRDLGQRAAALGRLGSGMVTSEAGDIFGQRKANLDTIKAQLAAQTSGQEQGDLLNKLSAAQGVTQGLGGLDLSQSGLGLQAGQSAANLALQRGQGLGNLAGQQTGLGQAQLGAQQGVLGQLAGLENQQYGQNMGNLNFLQGERGYQAGQDQQGIENRVREKQLQDQLLGSDYGRRANTLGMLGNLGFQGPSPTGLGLADLYSGQSGDSNAAIAELLRSLGQRQGN